MLRRWGARAAGETARARAQADADYNDLAPAIIAMRSSGLSRRTIAARLNSEG